MQLTETAKQIVLYNFTTLAKIGSVDMEFLSQET